MTVTLIKPSKWSRLPYENRTWCEYLEANGIDPTTVSDENCHRHVNRKGVVEIHFMQFVLNENGRRIIAKDGYLKRHQVAVETVPPVVDPMPRMGTH